MPGAGGGPGDRVGQGIGNEGAGKGAIGGGAGPGDDYLDRLRRWLNKFKHYPKDAEDKKQEGKLVVSFTILRDGTVRDAQIEHGSGVPALDEAALQMLRDASPVPPLPETYRPDQAAIALPVDYSLGLLHRMF